MSFSVLPRAKFYSSKQNTNTQEQTTTTTNQQTVKVNIDNVIVADNEPSVKTNEEIKQIDEISEVAKLPSHENDDDPTKIIEFLKLLLEAYVNNPIKYNGLVICQKESLAELIKTLVGCDEVVIETEDFEVECCSKSISNHFVSVSKIWIKNGDVSEVFKYRYSNYLEVFDIYKISLKFVYCE